MNIKITDVRVLKGDSAFLIDEGKTSILYDSGFGFTGFQVAENIPRELNGRELDFIFLTHSHYDHALGSAYILKRFPKAKVVAGEYAEKIFSKPSARAVMMDLDKKFALKNGVEYYENLSDNLRVDIPVSDGDKIKIASQNVQLSSPKTFQAFPLSCCIRYSTCGLINISQTFHKHFGKLPGL